jgi:hypothetical protein
VLCDGHFNATGTVTMVGARISGAVLLDDAHITGCGEPRIAFHGDAMTVGHDFSADRLTAAGQLQLVDAHIASTVEFHGATLINDNGIALLLDRAEILSSLFCDEEFKATGDVTAIGTHIKGSVYFNNAELGQLRPSSGQAPMKTSTALCLVRARIDGDLGAWRSFVAHGRIDLSRSSVGGDVTLVTTELKGWPTAVDFTNGRFTTLTIRGAPPAGLLDFTKAKADFFEDGPAHRTRGEIILDDFEYRAIQMTGVTVQQREQWLLRAMQASKDKADSDHDGYLPQPYDQLAEAYRRAGDDHSARSVYFAKYKRRNEVTSWRRWYSKLWNYLQEGVIGYGYRPLRALILLLVLFTLGVVLFRYGPRPFPIIRSHRLDFTLNNSAGYTLNLLLPTSALDERQVWESSNGLGEMVAAGLVVFGWLLTATVFAAVARVLQRN